MIKKTHKNSDKQENNALFWAADDCAGDDDNGGDDEGRGLQLCLRYGESVSAGARLRQQDIIFLTLDCDTATLLDFVFLCVFV